ncbi:MAG: hypothetical protein ACLFVW_08910, partial [Phycisphaerae bacterium]
LLLSDLNVWLSVRRVRSAIWLYALSISPSRRWHTGDARLEGQVQRFSQWKLRISLPPWQTARHTPPTEAQVAIEQGLGWDPSISPCVSTG